MRRSIVRPLSVCSVLSDEALEEAAPSIATDRFRVVVTAVLVILRMRSSVRQRNASNKMHKVIRQLDLTKSRYEEEFFSKAVNSSPLMCKVSELLMKFFEHSCDGDTIDTVISMVHQIKYYTLRICWRDFMEPLRQSTFKHQQEYKVLRGQFEEARLSYMRELSALRDQARCRVNPLEGMSVDPMIYWEPQQMATEEEKEFLNTAVMEIVKTVFESNPNLTENLALERLEKFKEKGESMEIESLKKQLLEVRAKLVSVQQEAAEIQEKESQKRITERWSKMRNLKRASTTMVVPGPAEVSTFGVESALRSEVLTLEGDLKRANSEIKELNVLRFELEQKFQDFKATSDHQQKVLTRKATALETKIKEWTCAECENLRAALREEQSKNLQLSESSQEEIAALRTQLQMMEEQLAMPSKHPTSEVLSDSDDSSSEIELEPLSPPSVPSSTKAGSAPESIFGRRESGGLLKLNSDLCAAAAQGETDRIRQMLARKHVHDVNQPNYDMRTALHVAASKGFLETVVTLVQDMRAFVNAMDAWGGTPLDDAVRNENHDVIEFLKSRGAESGASVAESRLPEVERRLREKEEHCARLENFLQQHLQLSVAQTCADSIQDAERLDEYSKVLSRQVTVSNPNELESLNIRLEASHKELEEELRSFQNEPHLLDGMQQDRVQTILRLKQDLIALSHQSRCAQASALLDSVGSSQADSMSGSLTARTSKCSNCEKLQEELEATRALLNEVQRLSSELAAKYKKSSQDNLTNSMAVGNLRSAVSSAAKCLSESEAFRDKEEDPKLKTCVETLVRAEKKTTWSRLFQGGDERAKNRREMKLKRLMQDIQGSLSAAFHIVQGPRAAYVMGEKYVSAPLPTQRMPSVESPWVDHSPGNSYLALRDLALREAQQAESTYPTSPGTSHGMRQSSKGRNPSSPQSSFEGGLRPGTSFVSNFGMRMGSKETAGVGNKAPTTTSQPRRRLIIPPVNTDFEGLTGELSCRGMRMDGQGSRGASPHSNSPRLRHGASSRDSSPKELGRRGSLPSQLPSLSKR